MISTLQRLYQRHTDFVLLLILFITFRLLTLIAFRPGGLVLDFSDFYWYRSFAELMRQGYYPYDNLWTTYPPLFPIVMLSLYYLSTLLPPWTYPNLWFTLLLGGFFLLFEIGNFLLLYLFSIELHKSATPTPESNRTIIRPCWLYAAFFVPVYTLTGWFESYPLFFFLLSLYLLLKQRPYLSAMFTGIGFMIKLIPLILMPVAVRLFETKSYELRIKNYEFVIPYFSKKTVIYTSIFSITVVAISWPFYWLNPALFFGPQLITAAREPWETVWALIDGNYNYGVIPLDMRNLAWTVTSAPPTRIPWLLVTATTALIYGLAYTRRVDWKEPRQALAFVGFTICLFMLWSKGYSPQWLGWILYFIALLLPNLRGITYAVILSVGNIIEANLFFIMFPAEHWLLITTVLTRTLLFTVLAVEFLLIIWPKPMVTHYLNRATALLVGLLLMGLIPGTWRLQESYFETRLQQSPYSATISRLQGEQVTGALLLNNHTVYDWFYPYLRHDYSFFMLDDYSLPNEPDGVQKNMTNLLNQIANQTDVLWVYDADAAETTASETVLMTWLDERPPAHLQDIDGGRLYLFILK